MKRHLPVALVIVLLSGAALPASDGASWDELRARLISDPLIPSEWTMTSVPGQSAAGEEMVRMRFYACRLEVPPDLAFAVAEQESNWQAGALSEKGALGVMQVMPGTADQYGLDRNRLLEFDYGAYAGLVILRDLLDRFSSPATALAAYYAGPGFTQKRYSPSTEEEIVQYVRSVLQKRQAWGDIRCR